MKQRLGIARALITTPELLILDEPINGLDPVGIKEMRDLFKRLSTEYRITLLISSHILGEIEQIADTVGVIRGGRLVEEVSMESIRGTQSEYIELQVMDGRKATYVIEHQLELKNYKLVDDRTVRIYDPGVSPSQLTGSLVQHGVEIESIIKRSHSLEEHFLNLVKGMETLLKLIFLEMRKHRFARNFGYAAIANVGILLFLIMIGVVDWGAEDYAFTTYPLSFMLIDTFARATFIILEGH